MVTTIPKADLIYCFRSETLFARVTILDDNLTGLEISQCFILDSNISLYGSLYHIIIFPSSEKLEKPDNKGSYRTPDPCLQILSAAIRGVMNVMICVDIIAIGYFLVVYYLCLKSTHRGMLFVLKWLWSTFKWQSSWDPFSYLWSRMKARSETEANGGWGSQVFYERTLGTNKTIPCQWSRQIGLH